MFRRGFSVLIFYLLIFVLLNKKTFRALPSNAVHIIEYNTVLLYNINYLIITVQLLEKFRYSTGNRIGIYLELGFLLNLVQLI